MTTSEEFDDPFLRHYQRDPLPDAGIRIILLTDLPPDRAEAVVAPLAECLVSMGRAAETRIVAIEEEGITAPSSAAWPTPTFPWS